MVSYKLFCRFHPASTRHINVRLNFINVLYILIHYLIFVGYIVSMGFTLEIMSSFIGKKLN